MRQLKDMQISLAASVCAWGGILFIAYGVSGVLWERSLAMAVVALAGGVSLAVATVLRKSSQIKSYQEFLKGQETRDLEDALSKKWMDDNSRRAIEAELKERTATRS